VADNTAPFRWGRKCRIDPQALVPPAVAGSEPDATGPDLEELRAAGCLEAYRRLTADLPGPAGLRRVVSVRVAELVLYQDPAYAKSYVQRVREMAASEERVCPGRGALAEAAARYLYKLMAYKDEYEVARLLVRPRFAALVSATFGRVRRERFHLHPPALRALGLEHKLRIPAFAARPALRLLYRLRFLRGTRWDPFGCARVRREERALVAWYNGLLDSALAALTPDNY